MRSLLLVATLLAAMLAGCAKDDSAAPEVPAVGEVAGSKLDEGASYGFFHGGGGLSFAVATGDQADLDLFDGQDHRLGRIHLADNTSLRFTFDRVASGDVVVQVLSLNGTLTARSGGDEVVGFRRMPEHVERHLLAQQEGSFALPFGLPDLGILPTNPADAQLYINLTRAPQLLRVLAAGTYSGLTVKITGAGGPLLEASGSAGPDLIPIPGGNGFQTVSQVFFSENVQDARLNVTLHADDLDGVIILEALSYSRAPDIIPAGARAAPENAMFTYGLLPDRPVRFQVHPEATELRLLAPMDGGDVPDATQQGIPGANTTEVAARVALYDTKDNKIAGLELAPGEAIAVPVSGGGDYVAVALDGAVILGADRAPADFELHPLVVQEQYEPSQPPSQRDEYAQSKTQVDAAGTPFRITPADIVNDAFIGVSLPDVGLLLGCRPEGTMRVAQGNETLGFGGDAHSQDASVRLRNAPFTLVTDGFGPGCGTHKGAFIESYVRPTGSA